MSGQSEQIELLGIYRQRLATLIAQAESGAQVYNQIENIKQQIQHIKDSLWIYHRVAVTDEPQDTWSKP